MTWVIYNGIPKVNSTALTDVNGRSYAEITQQTCKNKN
jgi:hypothetical protein